VKSADLHKLPLRSAGVGAPVHNFGTSGVFPTMSTGIERRAGC
jgi:hypothetical protein